MYSSERLLMSLERHSGMIILSKAFYVSRIDIREISMKGVE